MRAALRCAGFLSPGRFASLRTTRPCRGDRGFRSTSRLDVKAGDQIPGLAALAEGSPGNKVNLAEELGRMKGIVIGVPGAFSGACSATHVPSYIQHPKIKEAGQVFVVAVNDAFGELFRCLRAGPIRLLTCYRLEQ
jgi:hypothetical protein